MKIKKFKNINENYFDLSAMEIIDEIKELSNYANQDNEDELRENMNKINDLILDLMKQCE